MANKVLLGKKVILSGANQGLGLEIAKKFAQEGADLMLCARNKDKLQSALLQLNNIKSHNQKIVTQTVDVSNEKDVVHLISETLEIFEGCDILINNAGIYGPKGKIEKIDWTDWKNAIETNLYGSVLMSRTILPHFKKNGYGKIIQLSGGGATTPLPFLSAYAASKAAVVRFSETLAEEVRGSGICVNCVAPGALNTKMLDEVIEAGPEKVGQQKYNKFINQKKSGGDSFENATKLILFLASNYSDGITGKLISAVWDNWEKFPEYAEELSSSDVYTIRRIIGKERGLNWADK